MKKNVITKALALILALTMCFALVSCGSSNTADNSTSAPAEESKPAETPATTEEKTEEPAETAEPDAAEPVEYNIAIVKQLDHASLDEIANAIAAQLDVIAQVNNITINYTIYSGQNDQSTLMQIGNQVVDAGVDAIIPIATMAAQVMTVCAEESKTPVIFSAVTDPEAAELTGIDYVTGTSDALNTPFIMDMMFAQKPEIKKVGLLYSLSEINSAAPIAEAKEYLTAKNIEFVEATGNTNDEIIAATSVLVSENVDVVFTPTDNVVMAAELAIADTFIENGILHYTGADSFVRNGGFTTCGVNYTDLGTKTADIAYTAIIDGMANLQDFYLMDGGIITVNTETATALNADYSVFASMGELVEVITTED